MSARLKEVINQERVMLFMKGSVEVCNVSETTPPMYPDFSLLLESAVWFQSQYVRDTQGEQVIRPKDFYHATLTPCDPNR